MTDETRQLLVRAPSKLFDEIDAWRRKQPDLPGRAEAVRRLLKKALENETPKRTKK
jgi:metal-responsive CopG/Arc/MetJ family transcriptional regulator